MNAAFSAVPTMSGDSEFVCGLGVGRYDNKNAIATSCGARFSEQLTANIGTSFLPGGSESFLLGDMPSVAFRAGISFKFGKSYASSSANNASASSNVVLNKYQLSEARREVGELRTKFARLESLKAVEVAEMKSLKAEARREVDELRTKVANLESLKAVEVAGKASESAEMKSLSAEVAEMKLMMAGFLGNRVVAMR
jgi:hypothetical protein